MPYTKSRARKEFNNKAVELLRLARQISFKNVLLSYEHKNLIFQSCIVLLCSSIEEYLRVLIEDVFFSYRSNNAPLGDVPLNPKTYALFQKQREIYEGFVRNRDEVKILERLDITNTSIYSVLDNNLVLTNHIDAQAVLKGRKYPSPKNLKVLFNRLGIKYIFFQLNSKGQKDYELVLRSFLDIRETIAHQESTPLTFADVQRHFANIIDFINQADRVVYSHICTESGEKYWTF